MSTSPTSLVLESNGDLRNYVGSLYDVLNTGANTGLQNPFILRSDGTVFSLQTGGALFSSSTTGTQQVDANIQFQSIFLGTDGTLYAMAGGNLYVAPPNITIPTLYQSNVQALVQDNYGTLYELTNGSLYVLQAGSPWALAVPPSQSNVESLGPVTGGSAALVTDDEGNSYQFNGTTWTFLSGPVFVLTPSANTEAAGNPDNFTLSVDNVSGIPVTTYNGSVTLTSSDGDATGSGFLVTAATWASGWQQSPLPPPFRVVSPWGRT